MLIAGLSQAAAGSLPPSTAEKYKALQHEIGSTKPELETAKAKSVALHREAKNLQQRLIATAARVRALEASGDELRLAIGRLDAQQQKELASLSGERVKLVRLLAILERLQADLPPPIALEQGDVLRAARGTMVMSASLPSVYRQAIKISASIRALRATRADLVKRRMQGVKNAEALVAARRTLDQLLAIKENEAVAAAGQYSELAAKLAGIASEAQDIKSLLNRIAALRTVKSGARFVTVAASGKEDFKQSRIGTLVTPILGAIIAGGPEGVGGDRAPGLSIIGSPGESVVAPADSQVLFAGPYHKAGQVLILETPGGYDLVLAGLDRIDVRPGDQLLMGEPLGRMPMAANGAKLYFEVRRNGKGVSPAPWLGIDLKKAKKS